MATSPDPAKPILLTGAAGRLGGFLRPHLARRPGGLVSTDVLPFGPALPGERIVIADLGDAAAVDEAMRGVGAVVHFGAIRIEDAFERILRANIVGTYNVFESARRHGAKRIVYSSSVHAIGYYESTRTIDVDAPHRPDGYYGLSKCFGEDLGRLYVDKAGMDVACLRIGTVLEFPKVTRHLWTFLSIPDLVRIVDACLDHPPFGFAVVYAKSANRRTWWDNGRSPIRYEAQDDSERFADRFPDADADPNLDPARRYQGGPFILLDFGENPPPR